MCRAWNIPNPIKKYATNIPKMYTRPNLTTLEVAEPMLNKKIKLTIKIENAHGLMLSMTADTTSKGRNHCPWWLICQSQFDAPGE